MRASEGATSDELSQLRGSFAAAIASIDACLMAQYSRPGQKFCFPDASLKRTTVIAVAL
jgi:hypothetical protein